MQSTQVPVEVPYNVFCNILSKIKSKQVLDTKTMLITSGQHPNLGPVVLIDNPMGGRALLVNHSQLKDGRLVTS